MPSDQRVASVPMSLRIFSNPWAGFALASIVIGLDQYTKDLASRQLAYRVPVEITSWFDLTLAHNSGAAFSFLATAGGWQRWFFTGLGLIAAVVMIWLIRKNTSQTLFCLAMSLVLSGAIGNVIDRILYGAVVDFVDLRPNLTLLISSYV